MPGCKKHYELEAMRANLGRWRNGILSGADMARLCRGLPAWVLRTLLIEAYGWDKEVVRARRKRKKLA